MTAKRYSKYIHPDGWRWMARWTDRIYSQATKRKKTNNNKNHSQLENDPNLLRKLNLRLWLKFYQYLLFLFSLFLLFVRMAYAPTVCNNVNRRAFAIFRLLFFFSLSSLSLPFVLCSGLSFHSQSISWICTTGFTRRVIFEHRRNAWTQKSWLRFYCASTWWNFKTSHDPIVHLAVT